ncbi:MAG: thioredoxin family protein [Phycisphaerales bacterium]|nr:thioredoxin family protein [Phycisphaerales bacterium]
MKKTASLLAGLVGIAALGVLPLQAAGPEDQAQVEKKVEPVIGEIAPDFVLLDLEGKEHKLSEYAAEGKIVVLEWFNPECPFVKKHHVANRTMHDTHEKLQKEHEGKVVWLAINSGAPGHQGAGIEANKQAAEDYEIEYPVLLDESGEVGRAYKAKTTPHMFVIGADGKLAYMGAIDNNPSPRKVGDINYVLDAVTALLAGETVEVTETKSYGCPVKFAD